MLRSGGPEEVPHHIQKRSTTGSSCLEMLNAQKNNSWGNAVAELGHVRYSASLGTGGQEGSPALDFQPLDRRRVSAARPENWPQEAVRSLEEAEFGEDGSISPGWRRRTGIA